MHQVRGRIVHIFIQTTPSTFKLLSPLIFELCLTIHFIYFLKKIIIYFYYDLFYHLRKLKHDL
jgi:hypothetical protein